jgi:hypothetical protein
LCQRNASRARALQERFSERKRRVIIEAPSLLERLTD